METTCRLSQYPDSGALSNVSTTRRVIRSADLSHEVSISYNNHEGQTKQLRHHGRRTNSRLEPTPEPYPQQRAAPWRIYHHIPKSFIFMDNKYEAKDIADTLRQK